ncbi:MAG: hypothetical protein HETSPECPRED_009358 [Heterodermia speciosa]|uniref:Uncharacterized protein n=1 Tax=Heterodermia speciosa TaxID=116794 RepID=A0A8H3FYS1_9LECA|nr:MAG: hypothetical protein HETSPECPRED_009358 [Heterodermia speciosa]
MSSIHHVILAPILLLVSLPLLLLATLTTTLAFSILLVRVALVYAELGAVLLQNYFSPPQIPSTYSSSKTARAPPKSPLPRRTSGRKSRRGSTGSGQSNGGSTTPRAPETSGLGIYSGGGVTRDFEGVGGWRIQKPGQEDEDGLWANMNSRLELPIAGDERQRHHRRSYTGGSLGGMPPVVLSPARSRARTPVSRREASGGWGEDALGGYLSARIPSKSTTDLDKSDANIGRLLLRPKVSSMFSSESSSRSTASRSPVT